MSLTQVTSPLISQPLPTLSVTTLSAATYQGNQPTKWDGVYTNFSASSGNYAVKNANNFFSATQTIVGDLSSTATATLSNARIARLGINTAPSSTYLLDVNGAVNTSGALTVLGTTNLTNNLTVNTNTFFVDTVNNRVGVGTATPNERLTISGNVSATGGLSLAYAEKTTNYTATANDYTIVALSAITVQLPASNTVPTKLFNIKNLATSTVTVSGWQTELIDGTNFKYLGPYDCLTIQARTGGNWIIL
jgi:hypothetical protein